MKTLRTDGGGENFADERLSILRKLLIYFGINKIEHLHDHKGMLTVFWKEVPNEIEKSKVANIWADTFYEYEIEHKLLTYIEL
jgi:hypothetical protein